MYKFYIRCLIYIWKAFYLYKTFISKTSIKSSSEILAFVLVFSHSLLYILIRIIEHQKSRKSCKPKDLIFLLNQNDKVYFITTWCRQIISLKSLNLLIHVQSLVDFVSLHVQRILAIINAKVKANRTNFETFVIT